MCIETVTIVKPHDIVNPLNNQVLKTKFEIPGILSIYSISDLIHDSTIFLMSKSDILRL